MSAGALKRDIFGLLDNFDAFRRAAVGGLAAGVFDIRGDLVHDHLGGIAVHLEHLGAEIHANLVAGAKITIDFDLHYLLLSKLPPGLPPLDFGQFLAVNMEIRTICARTFLRLFH